MATVSKSLLFSVLLSWALTTGAEELPILRLSMKDGRFQPELLKAPANIKFKLILKNEGATPEEFESEDLHKEKVLAPGAESFLIFQPLKPGSYKFFGEFHPQTAQGRLLVE